MTLQFGNRWTSLGLCLGLSLSSFAAVGCSSTKTPVTNTSDTAEDPDATDPDAAADANGDAKTQPDSAAADGDTQVTPGDAQPSDTALQDADVTTPGDSTGSVDTDSGDTGVGDVDGGATPDIVKGKSLPLDESCAGPASMSDKIRCQNCSKCGKLGNGICVSGKTYQNDCFAICDLQAYDYPGSLVMDPNPCPTCAKCIGATGNDLKPACVTLKNNQQVNVPQMCEASCADFKPKTDGSPTVTLGACKTKCLAKCNTNLPQPVCAKEDGQTYWSECAMENCDLDGCFLTSMSATCANGKMTKECDGACFDPTADVGCAPSECAPTCAIKTVGGTDTGVTYRSQCVAKANGAKVLTCDGLAPTAKDQCSATMYNPHGCCDGVYYDGNNKNPVCYSHPSAVAGKDDWVTFFSPAEFDCLTAGDNTWTKQHDGVCVGHCPDTVKYVCGTGDGATYLNACEAIWYNDENFNYSDGPCK